MGNVVNIVFMHYIKERLSRRILKKHSNSQVENKVTTPLLKRKRQTDNNIHKAQYWQPNDEQHEPYQELYDTIYKCVSLRSYENILIKQTTKQNNGW